MSARWVRGAVALLPTLLVAGWAGWLGWTQPSLPSQRIGITGFDPRDLLRGHYVQFRLDLAGDMAAPCACITPAADGISRPAAAPVSCEPAALGLCLHPIIGPGRVYRYYLSQAEAARVERELAAEGAAKSVLVHFSGYGDVSFSDLR